MTKLTVAVTDSVFPNLEPAAEALSDLDVEIKLAAEPTEEAILDVARDADGLLVTYAKITSAIISNLNNCRAIGRFGIGVDNIDIDAATEAGIVVTYVPDYCVDEVSDHAMALLVSLARKIPFSNTLVQNGRWEMPAVVPMNRLRGRKLGLAGFGKIPQAIVPKARAFGLDIMIFDPYVSDQVVADLGVTNVDFDTLLSQSDYISIHAPLTPETENLFNAEAFRKMKNSAMIINTARGPLVSDADLAEALDKGEIAGAGLDVVPVEPLPKDSPLLGRDNVILTPHTGFYSVEALVDLQSKAARDVGSVLKGERPVYPINPQVLDKG
jgi:D-3-phosphoglycerate dehydrogenase